MNTDVSKESTIPSSSQDVVSTVAIFASVGTLGRVRHAIFSCLGNRVELHKFLPPRKDQQLLAVAVQFVMPACPQRFNIGISTPHPFSLVRALAPNNKKRCSPAGTCEVFCATRQTSLPCLLLRLFLGKGAGGYKNGIISLLFSSSHTSMSHSLMPSRSAPPWPTSAMMHVLIAVSTPCCRFFSLPPHRCSRRNSLRILQPRTLTGLLGVFSGHRRCRTLDL